MRFGFDRQFAKRRRHAHQFGEVRIPVTPDKSNYAEDHEHGESQSRVTPGATKRARKLTRIEISNALGSLRVGAIDTTMRTNDQTVEIVDQPRIAGLRAGDSQVGSGAAIRCGQSPFAPPIAMTTFRSEVVFRRVNSFSNAATRSCDCR